MVVRVVCGQCGGNRTDADVRRRLDGTFVYVCEYDEPSTSPMVEYRKWRRGQTIADSWQQFFDSRDPARLERLMMLSAGLMTDRAEAGEDVHQQSLPVFPVDRRVPGPRNRVELVLDELPDHCMLLFVCRTGHSDTSLTVGSVRAAISRSTATRPAVVRVGSGTHSAGTLSE